VTLLRELPTETRPTAKRKLNLAAGNRIIEPLEQWEHHDRWAHRAEIETVHDLREYPWPWADDTFDEIVAFDIIEHMQDGMRFIEELWRIAMPDANVIVHTAWAGPSADARYVWRDPTHVRPYHEESFLYFDAVNGKQWFGNYGKFYSRVRFLSRQVRMEPPDNILFRLQAMKPGSELWTDDWV
jgi:hypothetical protein